MFVQCEPELGLQGNNGRAEGAHTGGWQAKARRPGRAGEREREGKLPQMDFGYF